MSNGANIIIADESALFFYLHSDVPFEVNSRKNGNGARPRRADAKTVYDNARVASAASNPIVTPTFSNPLAECASSSADFKAFNPNHPLYGGTPVSVLVAKPSDRRRSKEVQSRCCPCDLPAGSFLKIREGLFLASPELVFARMANFVSDIQLAEIGMNLCGRYYIEPHTESIEDRRGFATTPERLRRYLEKTPDLKGSRKALKVLQWVVSNAGSPMETKMMLQFHNPHWTGGMALPFTHMNYDVSAGRFADMTEQNEFCIDAVDLDSHTGLEYDGSEAHLDVSKDRRRLNSLRALGWHVFAIDKSVLYDPQKTLDTGRQIAKHIGMRVQFPRNWERYFAQLRNDLELPV